MEHVVSLASDHALYKPLKLLCKPLLPGQEVYGKYDADRDRSDAADH